MLHSLSKIAVLGAYGAVGGLVGALLGQILLATAFARPAVPVKQSKQPVDVVFVLDVTNSMSDELSGIRRGIREFLDTLSTSELDAQVGLVSFRDQDVQKPEPLLIRGKPLTRDVDEFSYQLSTLQAAGGGDEPESSIEALAAAAKQPLRPEAAKVLVLITDAPPRLAAAKAMPLAEAITVLRDRKIDQLYLVVQDADRAHFAPLRSAFAGQEFSLAETASERQNFQPILDAVAQRLVREIRIASPLDSGLEVSTAEIRWLTVSTAAWTAVVGAGIFLLLALGQSHSLGMRFPKVAPTLAGMTGAALAGAAAGAVGALGISALASVVVHLPLTVARFLPDAFFNRLLAWGLLGGLLGLAISYFIPNLKRGRASLGGMVGGMLGALSFLLLAPRVGNTAALPLGAAVLGAAIGLMVAVVEAVFRSAWLEINYGREVRTVTLGADAVTIGSDTNQCVVYARGTAPLQFRYMIEDHAVWCEDVPTRQTFPVVDGDRRVAGNVVLSVRTSRSQAGPLPTRPVANAPFRITLSNGRLLSLAVGSRLHPVDLPGLQPDSAEGIVAEVGINPANAAIIGLKNRTQRQWSATVVGGTVKSVEPGKSIQLVAGTRIDFGPLSGVIT